MCGIVGWVDWQRNLAASKETVVKMARTLSERGPDAEGFWVSSRAVLGHRRLIVIDPEGGQQPMLRKKGEHEFVIVYNGELYNTEDIRTELLSRGYHFNGHSDTEVLLLSYMEWGPACLERLNGIFAFGIWDSNQQRLFLARDRMGVKPLFYSEHQGCLLFASEVKAILAHPDIKPRVGIEGLAEIFLIGPARTPGIGIYEGIGELKPGQYLLFTSNGVQKSTYWQLTGKNHEDDLGTTKHKVRELFIDAVKRQLISDVPIGTLLSGGLDSSLITSVAAKELDQAGKGPLTTFSIDYVDNDKYFQANDFQPNSDAPWVKRVSEYLNTSHYNFELDNTALAEALHDATIARDFPGMADIDSSLLLFSRKIKDNVTVALSGECADEVFGGYPWFHKKEALEASTFPWALNLTNRLEILAPELIQLLKPNQYITDRYQEALKELEQLDSDAKSKNRDKQEQRIREISYLTLTRFMPTLLDRKDRMSMAVGLEVRVPFCDHRIVEYVWNIPWHIKAYNGREKGLLRAALEGILPDDVLWRRKSPYPKTHNPVYLNTVRNRLSEILQDRNSPIIPLINEKALQDLMSISHTIPSGRPWFGQLMDIAQLFAYLIQVDDWIRSYKVQVI